MDEMILVRFSLLKPLVFNAYFKAEISTEDAAEMLEMVIPDFVEMFDEWILVEE